MRDLLIGLGFCSVVFLSMGFLALAFIVNRDMTKDERERQKRDKA